jgi:hypothetical protein
MLRNKQPYTVVELVIHQWQRGPSSSSPLDQRQRLFDGGHEESRAAELLRVPGPQAPQLRCLQERGSNTNGGIRTSQMQCR